MKKSYDWLTVRILIGLPGSGKTTFIKNSMEEYNSVFDDILSPDDITRFIEACNEYGGLVVIADCNLCSPISMGLFENAVDVYIKREAKIEKIYFENNPDACRHNALMRNDGRDVEGSITNLSREYHPPEDSIKVIKYDRPR